MIPGGNILAIALKIIAPLEITYFKFDGRTTNNIGNYINIFDSGISIKGSWQPVSRNVYMAQGLDFQKSYFNLYVPNNIIDISRDVSGDELEVNGRRFKCESATPWYSLDGWTAILCVDIGPATSYKKGFGAAFGAAFAS